LKTMTACPVCKSTDLASIGSRALATAYPPSSCFDAGNNVLLEFVLQKKDAATQTLRCRECSHIFLSPTFDQAELDRFYSDEARRLTSLQYRESERVSGKSWAEQNRVNPDRQDELLETARTERARRLKSIFESQKTDPVSICDVGGMDGQIMSEFASSRRFVFDKVTKNTNQFCTYLNSPEEMAANAPYELLIFSHVLEHIPEPREFLAQHRKHLAPGGSFYLEVPLEYQGSYLKRRGIPLGGHVNYFTMPSLKRLAAEIGMSQIVFARKEVVWYGELRMAALKLICRASDTPRKPRFFWPWEVVHDTFLHFSANASRRRYLR
jgi:hypothetical protein